MPIKVKGLTLIELIVTLSIATLVSFIAAPSMLKFIEKQKVSSDLLKVKSIIETARNHAISNNSPIRICGLENIPIKPEQNDIDCQRDWTRLNVFTLERSKKPELIHTHHLDGNYEQILWSSFQRKAYLQLQPNGFTNHQNGTLYLCHNRHQSLHRALSISKSGRVTIHDATDSIIQKCDN
ncbi:GspH/FimT family pseudopilin [Kangiella koreensis]|uniref:Type II secretion system protein H n=1 Tax=Kangiella koreensis (strain DSM 16069 / JCM 12317 / KCTC 12182 / SW-125) TaxID=523791 RepID=C7RB53_KANKD|nr:GspH/FimT family pseudopilin [Kangiella koreensis]ACV26495.1 Tfp pilus assembly protein FimT [Kangiella koreensis DSM 16069]